MSEKKNDSTASDIHNLTRLRCLVIGGSSGIGLAVAQRLEPKVRAIVVADRQQGDSLVTKFVQMDVTDESSVSNGFSYANEQMGGIDIVVNTAGILGKIQSIQDETLAEFEHLIKVNLTGAFIVSRIAVPYLLESISGRLVHFSSTAGKEGVAFMPGYSASKAGIMGLVKSLAKEYAMTSLTVNAVAPGKIDSPMIADTPPSEKDLSHIPMGRLGRTDEAAALVEYIVSPDASYTTGVVFDLSGGRATY